MHLIFLLIGLHVIIIILSLHELWIREGEILWLGLGVERLVRCAHFKVYITIIAHTLFHLTYLIQIKILINRSPTHSLTNSHSSNASLLHSRSIFKVGSKLKEDI